MVQMELSESVKQRILAFQKDEITSAVLYEEIAAMMKNDKNRNVLLEIAQVEREHYATWKHFTGIDIGPSRIKIALFKLLYWIMGETFVIQMFERVEDFGIRELTQITSEIPEANDIILQEEEHENQLITLVDEERLKYVGAMVLGLNDALVELTGMIAGMTFALSGTKIVALTAVITGAAATLSMAASNYLAERAERSSTALKSSFYTGIAYLITVVLLVMPYLILPDSLYITAFTIMIITVILIILFFTFYLSVVQSTSFWSRFKEMAGISLGVAAISFVIGLIAKMFIGVDL
jgi:VIT1/CCC1 family predicted Fe2+/Mn2+ transporter